MTTNHPAHGPVSLDRLHQISEILSKAAAQSEGGNLGYAMADAVKVIDWVLASEPVADVVAWSSPNEERICDIRWRRFDVAPGPLYTATPAPVVQKVMSRLAYLLDEDQFHNIESMVLAAGIHPAGTSQVIPEAMSMEDLQYKPLTKSWREGWNACRAAMLQAGNSPVTPDDVRRMDWLVSKTIDVREPMVYGSHSIFWSQTITDEDDDYHATKLREQIDAAMAAEQAAAPQQEDL